MENARGPAYFHARAHSAYHENRCRTEGAAAVEADGERAAKDEMSGMDFLWNPGWAFSHAIYKTKKGAGVSATASKGSKKHNFSQYETHIS